MSQLDIFSWESDLTEQAWQALAAFRWHDAEQFINEITSLHPSHEVASLVKSYCDFWQPQIKSDLTKDGLLQLAQAVQSFSFTSDWGPQRVRKSLVLHCIRLAEELDLFFLGSAGTVADFHLQLEDLDAAEESILREIQHHHDPLLYYHHGNVLWQGGNYAEARRIYMEALLRYPECAGTISIHDKELELMIERHGAAEAVAWSACYRQRLPLEKIHLLQNMPDTRGADLCRRVLAAENPQVDKVSSRKALHAVSPDLFKAWLRFRENGTEPS